MKKILVMVFLTGLILLTGGCGMNQQQEGTGTVSVAQSDTEESAPQEADENETRRRSVKMQTRTYRKLLLMLPKEQKNTVDLSWTMFFIPKMTAIFILICMCPTAMTEADPMQSFLHYPDMKDYISRGWEKICTVKTSDSPPGSIIRR